MNLSQEIEKRKNLILDNALIEQTDDNFEKRLIELTFNLKGFLEGCLFELKEKLLPIKILECQLDELNGNKGELCLYCGATEYDGIVGIKHFLGCQIIELRTLINQITADIKLCEKELGEMKYSHALKGRVSN